jgi:hypothetical protein
MTTRLITTDNSFRHKWQAEILLSRPLILPSRHFTYPHEAEEVERGALELLVRSPSESADESDPERPPCTQEFLATCALGFRDPSVPTGVWTSPNPRELCAVSGGYAYIVDTTDPRHFTMIPYRPVLEVRAVPEQNLLLFVGHRSILAWGSNGKAWESQKLSDEGVKIERIDRDVLHGTGWEMMSDKEIPFTIDLQSGSELPPG